MADFISFNGFHWGYECYGEGAEILLAFHGFGNAASDFKALIPSLGKKYKIVAFNLPYHGNSTIDASVAIKSVSKDHLAELTERILRIMGAEKFSLIGYSLGGKMFYSSLSFFHKRCRMFT
jgi:pimeloyl-ACP methyl ester carboxylesterase